MYIIDRPCASGTRPPPVEHPHSFDPRYRTYRNTENDENIT